MGRVDERKRKSERGAKGAREQPWEAGEKRRLRWEDGRLARLWDLQRRRTWWPGAKVGRARRERDSEVSEDLKMLVG